MELILLPCAIFYAVVSALGIPLNFLLIIATLENRKMHSACPLLIAIACLSDIIHQLGHALLIYFMVTSQRIPQNTCFLLQIIPLLGICSGMTLLFSLGIDRLIAVMKPHRYRHLQSSFIYLLFQLAVPALFSGSLITLGSLENMTNELVVCVIPNGIVGRSRYVFLTSGLAVNLIIISVYLAVWILLKAQPISKYSQGIFHSIAIVVLLSIGGWLITTSIVFYTMKFMDMDSQWFLIVQTYAGIPVNLSCSLSYFVYYFVSSDYRKILRRQWQFFGLKVDHAPNAKPSFVVNTS